MRSEGLHTDELMQYSDREYAASAVLAEVLAQQDDNSRGAQR